VKSPQPSKGSIEMVESFIDVILCSFTPIFFLPLTNPPSQFNLALLPMLDFKHVRSENYQEHDKIGKTDT